MPVYNGEEFIQRSIDSLLHVFRIIYDENFLVNYFEDYSKPKSYSSNGLLDVPERAESLESLRIQLGPTLSGASREGRLQLL